MRYINDRFVLLIISSPRQQATMPGRQHFCRATIKTYVTETQGEDSSTYPHCRLDCRARRVIGTARYRLGLLGGRDALYLAVVVVISHTHCRNSQRQR